MSASSQNADARLLQHSFSRSFLSCLFRALPDALLRQHEYEIALVTSGKHLLHSTFLRRLAALASDVGLDYLLSLPSCSRLLHKLAPLQTPAAMRTLRSSRVAEVLSQLVDHQLWFATIKTGDAFLFQPRRWTWFRSILSRAPSGGGAHRAVRPARRIRARVQPEAASFAARRRQTAHSREHSFSAISFRFTHRTSIAFPRPRSRTSAAAESSGRRRAAISRLRRSPTITGSLLSRWTSS